jgi:predicted KAP-like P-loop ATPase
MWRDSETSDDFLNYTEVADQIATLTATPSLLPISIGVFGGWGTGKSTVLKLVQDRLVASSDHAPVVVQFDAWLYQGFDDARAALMEVISADLLSLAEKKKTLIDKAKSFAGRINYFRGLGLIADFGVGMAFGIPPGLLTAAGAAVSALASGKGNKDADFGELKKDVGEATHGLHELIRPAEKKTPPQEIAAFRQEFSELLEGLDTTVVVFIDNLDRCLPEVAIGTLEAVRLFLFMPRTAFIIAADEDMIRHSVARHFQDPNSSHVRDYLDKVIQVPLRVPQVGTADLRAYMYSLFVADAAPDKLSLVQARLLKSLQEGWSGDVFDKDEINKLAGSPSGLLDHLAIADQLAPILVAAPNVQGNPRIVKRLLNAIWLRRGLSAKRNMNVDLATLAKLAVFERCTDGPATLALYRLVMEGGDSEDLLKPAAEVGPKKPDLPTEWSAHSSFIEQWREMAPAFGDVKALRPAVFLSRDVLAPAPSRVRGSEGVQQAVDALYKVNSVTSPVGQKIVDGLSAVDRRVVMAKLIEAMRGADWSAMVPGIHGAIQIASASPDAKEDLKAFISGQKLGKLHTGIRFLLKQAELLSTS